MQTDKGIVLARALIEHLRRQSVIVPALNAVERASAEAITRAVFFNRPGNPRPQLRAAALPGQRPQPVTAAIVLWNTVYLERAANALRGHGQAVDDGLLQYLSPLGWEHINLTGDYLWRSSAKIGAGKVQAATAAATGLACFI